MEGAVVDSALEFHMPEEVDYKLLVHMLEDRVGEHKADRILVLQVDSQLQEG